MKSENGWLTPTKKLWVLTFWPLKTWAHTQAYMSIHIGLSFMLMGQWLSALTHLSLTITLIRLISYLRNRLKGQLAKTLHLVVCVGLCVFCFCIFLSVFIYASLYVFHCVCARVNVCACLCLCAPLQDISIGRPILSSLWVDFKGEEISAGFSRLVNSLSPESGVFSSCVCMGVCAYLTLLTVCVCMCLCTCTCVHVFKCIHWLPKHWLMAIKKAFTRGSIPPSRCWCLYVRACVCEKMYWMQAFSCMEENMHELCVCVHRVC